MLDLEEDEKYSLQEELEGKANAKADWYEIGFAPDLGRVLLAVVQNAVALRNRV
ncbi:MAG: hypothetical protein O6757_05315 [Alphaproteobacteria bacterium]|nr:hypothetical protein [Alphaproteobacteria bacterium]